MTHKSSDVISKQVRDHTDRQNSGRAALLYLSLAAAVGIAFVFDERVMAVVRPIEDSAFANFLDHTLRWLGDGRFQVPALLALLAVGLRLDRRLTRASGYGLLAFLISGGIANALKLLVHRARPWRTVPPPESWSGYLHLPEFHSFPSGDTSTTFALAVTLGGWFPRLRGALLAVAVMVGLARILVGGHYPSDVFAGALLGIAVGHLVNRLADRRGARRLSSAPTDPAVESVTLKRARRAALAALLLGVAIIFLAGLGWLPLVERDEALYAEAAREMLASGDWITPRVNGVAFLEKPPLYYWLAAASYRLFDVSPFAARLPSALSAILTVMLTFAVGSRVWGWRAGLLAGIALATSLQMALIGRLGIMDAPLALLTFLALLCYVSWRQRGAASAAAGFGALIGLAVLLKGLAGGLAVGVALLHLLLQVARGYRPRLSGSSARAGFAAVGAFAMVAAPWFVAMAGRHGETFAETFFVRQHWQRIASPLQGHGGSIAFYLALIAITFFPWVVFLPKAMSERAHRATEARNLWHSLCVVWIGSALVAFSVIGTKLPGYVTPLFPPMALLVGVELDRRMRAPGRATWIAVAAVGLLLAGAVSLLPLLGATLGARVGASQEAWRLVVPSALWAGACVGIALGALLGASGRPASGIRVMAGGQMVAVAVVLVGFLPVLSPYLGGATATLTGIARAELGGRQLVLYDTYPEAAAFELERPLLSFEREQTAEVYAALRAGPTFVIAPKRARHLWRGLPVRRVWTSGDRMLLEIEGAEKSGSRHRSRARD